MEGIEDLGDVGSRLFAAKARNDDVVDAEEEEEE